MVTRTAGSPAGGGNHHVGDINRSVADVEGRAVQHRKSAADKVGQYPAGEAVGEHDRFGAGIVGEHL